MPKAKDLSTLIEVTKNTQTLLTHYQSSLAPSKSNTITAIVPASAPDPSTEIANPLELLRTSSTLLKSHTTTLSLLLINPPLTASAIVTKIGNVSEGPLTGVVTAASYVPGVGQRGDVGEIMRTEMRAQVKGLLASWSEVLSIVLSIAQKQGTKQGGSVTEAEKQQVLSATGMVWDACDGVEKLCKDGVVGLVVKKAQELRAVLLDAIEELKEWGEDVADDDDDDDEAENSDQDDVFATENKLGKDDKELKALLDKSLKKLKMMGILYQALVKRRLKTYPASKAITEKGEGQAEGEVGEAVQSPSVKLSELMGVLKTIPETVDDIAAAFYDLDADEAQEMLDRCCGEAKTAVDLVRRSWSGQDDEFTAWSEKWVAALNDAAAA
ncbi:hypothetical protein COCSADRAFT_97276 [Bipolaris sorokiniana ND90Pr]|uniref:Cyclin-D1-binding protein 1-like N-terminal domain-containing protein n=1 Tax=Cochliobolus sativus (strain ND90Pr / ATCC 201652) TaxID=665912 RepID=M2SE90_COCSN|nr:uncharacterized protein COCSADRAFT_97276 [Bipolaris sorokiniana ND90Pr]EMD60780.1 hypothetical protein COCSADRAFT_97276 [Bipolaris sorokiniana ND90Pr]